MGGRLLLLYAFCGMALSCSSLQELRLINQTSLNAVVRVGPFTPGVNMVNERQSLGSKSMAPGESASLNLPPGHYLVYAEAAASGTPAASEELNLMGEQSPMFILSEKIAIHRPTPNGDPSVDRYWSWMKN